MGGHAEDGLIRLAAGESVSANTSNWSKQSSQPSSGPPRPISNQGGSTRTPKTSDHLERSFIGRVARLATDECLRTTGKINERSGVLRQPGDDRPTRATLPHELVLSAEAEPRRHIEAAVSGPRVGHRGNGSAGGGQVGRARRRRDPRRYSPPGAARIRICLGGSRDAGRGSVARSPDEGVRVRPYWRRLRRSRTAKLHHGLRSASLRGGSEGTQRRTRTRGIRVRAITSLCPVWTRHGASQ